MPELNNRLYAALVLPMTMEGAVDEDAYRKLIRYYLEGRFRTRGGLIANAEAGEIYYLTREEKRRVVEITVEEVAGRMPVFAGVFGLATTECVDVARDAKSAGADGLFIMPPAGCFDLSLGWNAEKYPEYWLDQIKAIDEAVDMPMITHPSASPSPAWGIGVPGPAVQKICEAVPNIIGWKMTYHYDGIRKMWKVLRGLENPVSIMCAGGKYFHEFLAHDRLDGTVSGSWSYATETMLDHIDAWEKNDVVEARRIWEDGLSELHDYIYSDYSRLHLRYKIAAWLRGLIPNCYMRPPMPRPTAEEIATIHALLADAGLSVIELKQAA